MSKKKIVIIIALVALTILAGGLWVRYISNNAEKVVSNIVEMQILELTNIDEQIIEPQEANLENEEFKESGEIAYNGADKIPNVNVGKYKGLTYYSQADKRWANKKYGNNTMVNSGCGPTAAAMMVSSIKGEILPTTMADLFVKYGYRSSNSGTYWSAMKWIADVFDMELKETSNFNTMIDKLENNNYVIAICRNGLFTYGGHFIMISGIDGDNLKIYDPYLYNGKFNTSTRKMADVKVDGNTVYVSKENFRKYANAQYFYCYKNTRNDNKVNETKIVETKGDTTVKSTNYKAIITAKIGLNIRRGASTQYDKIGAYSYGTVVTIEAVSGNWGKTSKGWICLDYVKKVTKKTTKKYTTGTYKTISNLKVRSGPGINYKSKTYKQLTINARSQNKKLGNKKQNGYKKGVICTVIKVKGEWGYTRSGWINLRYCRRN